MDNNMWIALLLIALGTFAMRGAPLVMMKKHLNKKADQGKPADPPLIFNVLGATMIAAMFGVSLVPPENTTWAWVVVAISTLVTGLIWLKTRTMGLPIFVGVACYAGLLLLGH